MVSNYEFFLKADLSTYTGKWVAIGEKGILSFGDNAKEVYEKAVKLQGNGKVTLYRVPENETMIF